MTICYTVTFTDSLAFINFLSAHTGFLTIHTDSYSDGAASGFHNGCNLHKHHANVMLSWNCVSPVYNTTTDNKEVRPKVALMSILPHVRHIQGTEIAFPSDPLSTE